MANIAKFMSKDIGDLSKASIVAKSNLSKILGLDIPGGSCPDSVNAGTAVYGPISNLCNIVGGFGIGPIDYYRICIPASENLYYGPVEYNHNFTITLKALSYDYQLHIDMFMRDMNEAPYVADNSTYIGLGSRLISANVDAVLGPFEYLMYPDRDIIFEVVLHNTYELPMSSDIVAGHSLWWGTTPGPVWHNEIADSGKRALIVDITEV